MLFKGRYTHSLDNKGKTIIPKKFRDILGDSFVMVQTCEEDGQWRRVEIFTDEEWERQYDLFKEENAAPKFKNGKKLAPSRTTDPFDGTIDSQGRCVIDDELCKFAKLKKDIIFVGQTKHAEIWDVETYLNYQQSQDEAW